MGWIEVNSTDLFRRKDVSFHHEKHTSYHQDKVKFSGIMSCRRFKNSRVQTGSLLIILFGGFGVFFPGFWCSRCLRIQSFILLSKVFIFLIALDSLAMSSDVFYKSQWLLRFYNMLMHFLPFFFLFHVHISNLKIKQV